MAEDERAIRELVDRWMAASRAGDAATVRSLMADDVIFMVPGQPPFGKEAFADDAGPADMHVDGRAEVKELRVFGDWAYLRNYIEVTITRAGEPPVHRAGYTLSILRKESDGRWLLTRDANLVS